MRARFLTALLPERDDCRRNWREYAAAALSGLILCLAFPKSNLWCAAWVGMVPLFWALRGRNGKAAFYRGWAFGFAYFYAVFFFLNTLAAYVGIAPLGIFLLGVYQGLFGAVFAWGGAALMKRRPHLSILLVPAWWVVLEWIRSSGELGAPLGALALSLWRQTDMIQIVSVTGTSALSYLIVLFNLALAGAVFGAGQSHWRRWGWMGAALLAPLAVWGWGRLSRPASAKRGPAVDVLMVQPNIPQIDKWNSYDADQKAQQAAWDGMTSATIDLTERALMNVSPDLIIWPETAVPTVYFNHDQRYRPWVLAKVNEWGHPLFLGSGRVIALAKGDIDKCYNSAFLVYPGVSQTDPYYDKIHLVPFGEDLTYLRYVPFVEAFGLAREAFDRGSQMTVFRLPTIDGREARFCAVICFESTMPYLFRRAVENGAQFLVVITNDGWYLSSSGAAQHEIASVFRAVETRRWICRCANTGISCFISPRGEIVQSAALNTAAALSARIEAPDGDGKTFYTRWGDWFVLVCLLLSVAGLIPWPVGPSRREGQE